VIPEDWEVVLLDSVAKRGSGHTPAKGHPEYWGGQIKWISLQDTDRLDKLYIYDTAAKITRAGIANSSATMHDAGTVILSRDGGVGKSAIMKDDMAVSQHFMAWRCGPKLDNHFLYYWLQKNKSEFERIAMGNTIKTIGLPYFKKLVCPLPTKAEQEAIAEALSDADALIESLEQLIAKERQIKQGVMQELLTGKKRLPGFSGEWETSRFDGVLSRVNVKAHQIQASDYQTAGRYPVVDQGKEPVIGFSDRHDKRFECPQGGVIVFGDHTCIVKFVEFDFLVGADGTQVLRAKGGQCTRFQALHLQYKGVQPTGYNRHFKFLKEREFVTPPLPEQTAIAAILSDMDAEIEALEAKLAKARNIKQGMMQELLTGRVRLV
jgi:type I restriction enzyme S subunit